MALLDFHLLLIIITANAAPILANHAARRVPDTAIDGGLGFVDGRPLFGSSKTWRGLFFAVLLSLLVGALLHLPLALCLGMALLAMLGDLLSSFVKRRLNLEPSSRAMGLDQLPESLLPMLLAQHWFGLGGLSVIAVVFLFFILELSLSPLGYRLRIRKRPY